MKTVLTIGLVLACAGAAPAQSARGGFVGIGVHNVDAAALNDRLVARGYPRFSDNFLSFSGGYTWLRPKLLVSLNGHALFQPAESNDTHETLLTAGYALASLGLPIQLSPRGPAHHVRYRGLGAEICCATTSRLGAGEGFDNFRATVMW